MIIGLSGYARSGKDTAAEALAELGYVRLAFADKLREFLLALDPLLVNSERVAISRLSDIIEYYGWDGYKNTYWNDEIRRLLQRLGTDCGRNLIDDNIWVDATLKDLDPNGKYVITDCRFPNEAQAIKDRGGEVWRIKRKGIGPANDHISEIALDGYNFDAVLYNNWSIEVFKNDVKEALTF